MKNTNRTIQLALVKEYQAKVEALDEALDVLAKLPESPELYKAKEEIRLKLETYLDLHDLHCNKYMEEVVK